MIELLLKAENALALGMLDQAERVFWQAIEHDPRNAIAVVGLSRVALERGDEWTAMDFASRALAIDPDNATAKRLLTRLAEVIERRGDGPRGRPDPAVAELVQAVAAPASAPAAPEAPISAPEAPVAPAEGPLRVPLRPSGLAPVGRPAVPPPPAAKKKRGFVARLFGR